MLYITTLNYAQPLRKLVALFILCFYLSVAAVAQQQVVTIDSVTIAGNKRTKDYIILREAVLKANDTIHKHNINFRLSEARRNIYNTTLFDLVTVQPTYSADSLRCSISINVKERWPIYPLPIFSLVDRSYGEWIQVYNADLARTIYGIKFAHYNFTGRRDQLRLQLFNGYTRGTSISYVNPYTNPSLTEGIAVSASYSESKEIQFTTTSSNRLATFISPYKADVSDRSFINKAAYLGVGFNIRRGIFDSHNFSVSFHSRSISDSVASTYNPNYFGGGKSNVNFIDLSYGYRHINVNNLAYPLKGNIHAISVNKRGFGFNNPMDMFSVEGFYSKYAEFAKDWYVVSSTQGSIKFPLNNLSYVNQRGVGYGSSFLRGLDLFAIDGSAFAITKTTIKKKLVHFKIRTPFKIPFFLKKKEAVPFTIFAKVFSDMGYVYNGQNKTSLSNRFLYTYGVGADLLTFYDTSIGFHYGITQINQNGFFMSLTSPF